MNILEELNEVLSPILPIETGIFSDNPPMEYITLTPMSDDFALFADNLPIIEVNNVRIGVFVKGNYVDIAKNITQVLLDAGFTIVYRRFVGHENDTGYNHYNIDTQKFYL